MTSDEARTRAKRCPYCDGPGPFNIEDIIPVWMKPLLKPTSGIVVRHRPYGNGKPDERLLLHLTTKDICHSCNSAWGVIENLVKPIISDTIHPEDRIVVLDHDEQATVALWMVHKALCMELGLRKEYGYVPHFIPPWHFHEMYKLQKPPTGSRVLMFGFDIENQYGATRSMASKPRPGHPDEGVGYLATITFGSLGFQVVGVGDTNSSAPDTPIVGPRLVQIHPRRSSTKQSGRIRHWRLPRI